MLSKLMKGALPVLTACALCLYGAGMPARAEETPPSPGAQLWEEAPGDNAPAEEAPAEGTPNEENPGEGVPGEGTPGEGMPGGRPSGGGGGGRPSGGSGFGGFGGMSGGGGAGGSGSSSGVTAGRTLTDNHADGSKIMTPYQTLPLTLDDAPMHYLTLDGYALSVCLDGGEALFTASLTDGALTLTPVDGGACWQLGGAAIRLLQRSGVEELILLVNGEPVRLPTLLEPEGAIYARLRAEGHASADFIWRVDAASVTAEVEGIRYILTDNKLRAEEE